MLAVLFLEIRHGDPTSWMTSLPSAQDIQQWHSHQGEALTPHFEATKL